MTGGHRAGARAIASRVVAVLVPLYCVSVVVVLVVIDHELRPLELPGTDEFGTSDVVYIAAMLVSAAVGSRLLLLDPQHPVGWCFSGLAASIGTAGFSESWAVYGLLSGKGRLPGDELAAVAASSIFILWLVLIALVCSLSPTGEHLSPRWRGASWLMVASGLLWLLTAVLSPELQPPLREVPNPWAGAGPDLQWLRPPMAVVNNLLVLVAASSVLVRFRRSRGEERRRLLWLAVVAVPFPALVVVTFVAARLDADRVVDVTAAGFVLLLPLGTYLAITRYHLYDVDRILSRALSYLLVSGLMAAVYTVVVLVVARALGQTVSRSPTALVLATLAVAVAVRPVYDAVQDAVDRRFARRRWDALQQVRAFVADPTGAGSVQDVLRSALQDPTLHVAYAVPGRDGWVTEDGHPTEPGPERVVRAGRTVAAVSHGGDPTTTRAALEEAAPELDNAGLRAAIAVQLEEVRASRARIAQAQVDERRRIERDLHDGAQQRLLGTAAQLQAALLNGEQPRLRAALELGIAECRSAVLELRELANGLHPSALSDGGLTAALEDLSSRLPVSNAIEVPDQRYAPHVEATAWFVVCEAVTNAVKHAAARSVRVELREDGDVLRLAVVDDGCGGADAAGRGLRGLADRVEAVGGRLAVADGRTGGTRVEAVLPCGS